VGWDEKNIKYSADRCEKLKKWEYGFCFWESFKDSCLKKDDRKEGSRLLVTLLAIMPLLNILLARLSSKELNKFCATNFVKEAKEKKICYV
jgi:hypothetical protein